MKKIGCKGKTFGFQYSKKILGKMSKFLTDTLEKLNKIFLHILYQNILNISIFFEKKSLNFLAAGGGRPTTPPSPSLRGRVR